MRVGPFLVVAAVFHGVLGVSALLMPGFTAGLFGIAVDAAGAAIVRLLGATLLGVAAAFWWSRDLDPDRVLRGLLVGGCVLNLLSFLVVVLAVSGGAMDSRAWLGAAVRLLLAAGFGYFAFVKPRKDGA